MQNYSIIIILSNIVIILSLYYAFVPSYQRVYLYIHIHVPRIKRNAAINIKHITATLP